MRTRLNKDLEEFLNTFAISNETSIFADFLMKFAGIKVEKGNYNFNRYEPDVSLHVTNISLADVMLLLHFLNLSSNDYRLNDDFKLKETLLFEELLPRFKQEIKRLAAEAPQELKEYQLKSKAKLESTAISEISKTAENLLVFLNDNEKHTVTEEHIELSQLLLQLYASLRFLHVTAQFYQYVFIAHKKLDNFMVNHSGLMHDKTIEKNYNDLIKAIAVYEKFNRAEANNTVAKLWKELHDYVNEYEISTYCCDVFEETLLKLAGVTTPPKECHFDRGEDSTRLQFEIKGISQDETNTFVKFFQSNHDESAKENHPHFLRPASVSGGYAEEEKSYYIEVDGEALYHHVFPKFKEKIKTLNDNEPDALNLYREKSKVQLDKQAKEKITSLIKSLKDKIEMQHFIFADAEKRNNLLKHLTALYTVMQKDKEEEYYIKVNSTFQQFSSFYDDYEGFKSCSELDTLINSLFSLGIAYCQRIRQEAVVLMSAEAVGNTEADKKGEVTPIIEKEKAAENSATLFYHSPNLDKRAEKLRKSEASEEELQKISNLLITDTANILKLT